MDNKNIFEASVSLNTKGAGFVPNPSGGEDIMIENEKLSHALHGDTVRVSLLPVKDGELPLAEVVEIISRSKSKYVGTLEEINGSILLKPDDKRMYVPIQIESKKNLTIGQKIFVKLLDWKKDEQYPKAEVIKVLGKKGEHNTEMESIILEKGFDLEFPEEVFKNAEEIKTETYPFKPEEIAKRKDLRDETIFTIDPIDAKDFDDALSIKKLENGNYEIGVHIADVSYYVRPKSNLDKEASNRLFSVYLVDRTIPMLPETLSNDLCSLNPNQDRYAFSTIFEMTPDTKVVKRWFGKSVINSKKRFTYEEAQEILNKDEGTLYNELSELNKLAKIMAKNNTRQGTINFEKDEIKFELDISGVPVRIYKKPRLETHKLVEEFMLLSNREVAKFIYDEETKRGMDIGLMYRVHDVPDRERIRNLSVFLMALGYSLPIAEDGSVSPQDINALLNSVAGKAEESLVKTATIRTMSKAIYSTENTGHFGLAFEYYTHFASPIRRYPDLLVHRILEKILHDEEIKEIEQIYFEEMALRSTEKEINASEAERDSIKYKQIEFMSRQIGQAWEGVISGVTKWGIYVMDDNTLTEGMVHISKLGNDYFALDEKNYAIVGERTKEKFVLGDKIKVKVEKIDLDKRVIDLMLVK